MTIVHPHQPCPLCGSVRKAGAPPIYVADQHIVAPAPAPAPSSNVAGTVLLVAMGLGAVVSGITLWEKLR